MGMGMGMGMETEMEMEMGTWNGERGIFKRESLKQGIFKSGNL